MSAIAVPAKGYRSTFDWPRDDPDFEAYCDWFKEHLFIVDERDQVVPLDPTPEQKAILYYKYQCEKEGSPCWMLLLKARKLGCSTIAEGAFTRDGLEKANTRIYIIAHDDDSTSTIFQMTQNFFEWLPGDKKPEFAMASAKEIRLKDNGSSFKVRTAGAGGRAGRGATFTKVHFSELDKWPEPEALYGAVVNSIPDTEGVVVIAESTADGPMLLMNQLWDAAIEGRNEFMPFFFPWFESEKYRRAPTWKDLRSYGPREWLAKNRVFLDKCEEAHLDLIGGRDDGRVGKGGGGFERLSWLDRLRSLDEEGHGEADQGSGREDGGEHEGSGEGGQPARGQDEEAGTGAGGHLRGGDEAREADADVRHEGTGDDGQLPETGGSGRGGVQADPDAGGLDQGHPGRIDDGRGLFRTDAGAPASVRAFDINTVFKESLTDDERILLQRESLDLDQINWLRYCLWHRCKGDETRRKREYPSYPEEAFEATGADILDPRVINQWLKEAKETPPIGRGSMRADINKITGEIDGLHFDSEDRTGKIEVFEFPDPKSRYVLAIDCAQGNADGDWQVGFVLNVDTGEQAAEFRAKMDPDLCVDQLEFLAIWYQGADLLSALVMIEMNGGYGTPFMRHFADRGTCQIYEREHLDRLTKQYTKRHGWMTSTQTRPQMIAEMKFATRTEAWKIKSVATLSEARTLWENNTGKVEARPEFHDDGIMAGGIALLGRNWILGQETAAMEAERKAKSPFLYFQSQLKAQLREENRSKIRDIRSHLPVTKKGVTGRSRLRRDGRRSRI